MDKNDSQEITAFLEQMPKSVQKSILILSRYFQKESEKYEETQRAIECISGQVGRLEERLDNLDLHPIKNTRNTTKIKRSHQENGKCTVTQYLLEKFPNIYLNRNNFTALARKIAEEGIVPMQEEPYNHSRYYFRKQNQEICDRIDSFVIENTRKGKETYVTAEYICQKIGINKNGIIINPGETEDISFGEFKDRFGECLGKPVKIPEKEEYGYLKENADRFIQKCKKHINIIRA